VMRAGLPVIEERTKRGDERVLSRHDKVKNLGKQKTKGGSKRAYIRVPRGREIS